MPELTTSQPETPAAEGSAAMPPSGPAAPHGTGGTPEPSKAATSEGASFRDYLDSVPPEVRSYVERGADLRGRELQSGLTPKLQEAADLRRQYERQQEQLEQLQRELAGYGKADEQVPEKQVKEPETYAEFREQQRQLFQEVMDERLSAVDDYVESQRKRDVNAQMDALTETFPQLKDNYERERLARFAHRLMENREMTPEQAAIVLYHKDREQAAYERGRQDGLRGIQGAQTAAGASERPGGGAPPVPGVTPLTREEWKQDPRGAVERKMRELAGRG